MPSIRETLIQAGTALDGDEAASEARLLLGSALGQSSTWLYAHADDALSATEQAEFERLLDARRRGEPIAYLIGSRGFWTLDLVVTPDVLIPRPETELLVELALARITSNLPVDVADLGTGSGAIALAIASERTAARIVATDASAAALAVATANATRLGLLNVSFSHGDWCAALGGNRYAVIVSNPPYIGSGDEHLQRGDLRHEPPAALASGIDGLDAIRVISASAGAHLHDDGWLLIEHGWQQGAAVRAIFASDGYVDIETHRDLGDRDRVTSARWPGSRA